MKYHVIANSDLVDLGKASVETKGAAGFEIDVSSGRLAYLTGNLEA